MNTRTLATALALAAIMLVACAPGHGGQTDSASLEGTHWVLLTLNGRSPLVGTIITAEFLEDQITGYSGCNSYFGPYAVDGSTLQFEEMGLTAMACLEPQGVMVQETTYIEVLRDVAGYRLAGDRLEMLGRSSEVMLVYERQEVPEADPADLVGTEWSLVTLDDSPLDKGMTITISFEGNRYRGFAGCRHFEGDYHANGGEIRFTSTAMLEDECPGAGNEYYVREGQFTDSLTWARHWAIVGGQLEIQTVRGGVLLFAQATPIPEVTLEGTTTTPPTRATPDIATTVMAIEPPRLQGSCPSPNGEWRAEVVVYDCVRVGEVDEYAYEQLRLVQVSGGEEEIVASQLRYCGGLGAVGLDGLFWSPNSRYFYYTDAREGVPDGCGYWERPVIRVDTIHQDVERLGGGPVSPDRSKLATWVGHELVAWDVNGGETARVPANAPDAGAGPIAWSPDSESLVYVQSASYCPLSGKSYVVRVDWSELRQTLLLESEMPTFGGVSWDVPGELSLFDEQGKEWRYSFVTQELRVVR
jgi:heat shock protein HslJ